MVCKQKYDAVIIGTGPGGAMLASELSEFMNIFVLEKGDYNPLTGGLFQTAKHIGLPGYSLLFTKKGIMMTRGINVGGSSSYYYGTAFDPPLNLFLKYGIDLTKYVAEIKKMLPVKELPDNLMGPMAKRLMFCAKDLGYNWNKLNKFIYPEKVKDYEYKKWAGFLASSSYEAKWSARMLIDDLDRKKSKVVSGAHVIKIKSDTNDKIVFFKKNGKVHVVKAPMIFVCAGGVGTPEILKNSGFKNTGNHFFFDPLIAVSGIADENIYGNEFAMASGIHFEDKGFMMTDMSVPFLLHGLFCSKALKPNLIPKYKSTLRIMIKIKDNLGGKIKKLRIIDKELGKRENKIFDEGFFHAEKILKNAGAKNIFKSMCLAAHPGGTVKIGEHVNSDLETNVKNLFVCDSSVIPDAFGLPPTLTVLCMAKRLSEYIKNR